MEEAELQWRKEEMSEAKKKSEMGAILIEARKQRMREQEHFLAAQEKKEKVEFENILTAQKEVMETEKRVDDALKSRTMKHSKEIRARIAAKGVHCRRAKKHGRKTNCTGKRLNQ